MNFFIKEYKTPIKWNALNEPIEYKTSYAICRTSIWLWFAKLFPKNNIEFLYIDGCPHYYHDDNKADNETVHARWYLYVAHDKVTPKTTFYGKETAEKILKDIQTNPDKYYYYY